MCSFQSYFNHCFPLEKIKIKYRNRNPWVNKDIKEDIKKRENQFLSKIQRKVIRNCIKCLRMKCSLSNEKPKGNIIRRNLN